MAKVVGRTPQLGITAAATPPAATKEPWQTARLAHQNTSKELPDTPPMYDRPPTPPPKDSPSTPRTPMPDRDPSSTAMTSSTDLSSYFRPVGRLSRAGSVYSLSRVSFTSQISQLTAVHLPDAASLRSSISAIATSTAAARALTEAADQIQAWIKKASDVLEGLDAGDDAEWAAAAGRDGAEEVDQAVVRFEGLIGVYVSAVEELQLRQDAGQVQPEDMKNIANKLENVTNDWQRIKKSLADVKFQVELAMEWQELENTALGEIGVEIEELSRLIFEMEERRHHSSNDFLGTRDHGLDLDELETIVHEAPQSATEKPVLNERPSSGVHSSPLQTPALPNAADGSSILGLFARMQPLKASLDFLPMRLAPFTDRAKDIFPSACDQLEERRNLLQSQWAQVENDAECLRRELGEDRWNLVFRNAGKQALKLIDSVERSLTKVDESLGNDTHLKHSSSTLKKIEAYEAKKVHYCPAIDRVLSIVERGVKDRLTVNGEILRLRADLRQKWQTLQKAMKNMDALLDEYAAGQPANQQQLRDSISSIMSNDRSLGDSALLTPGSSPPSSVMSGRSRKGSSHEIPKVGLRGTPRLSHEFPGSSPPGPSASDIATPASSTQPEVIRTGERRYSTLPLPMHATPVAKSAPFNEPKTGSSPASASTPLSHRSTPKSSTQSTRPRWNYSKGGGTDYDVNQYYASLRAKAAASTGRKSSHPTSFSSNQPGSTSSPLAGGLTPVHSSGTRPSLSRKVSDLSLRASSSTIASEQRSGPRNTSGSAAYMHPSVSRDSSPLTTRGRQGGYAIASHSSPPQQYPVAPRYSPSPAPTSSGLKPKSSMGNLHTMGRGRRGSLIPVPTERARAASAVRTASGSSHIA